MERPEPTSYFCYQECSKYISHLLGYDIENHNGNCYWHYFVESCGGDIPWNSIQYLPDLPGDEDEEEDDDSEKMPEWARVITQAFYDEFGADQYLCSW